MAAHQDAPSLGFSRQEYWSGLPFPSPMHKSEKWKWSRSVMSDPQRPHGLQPSRLLHPWDFSDKSTGVGCHCLLQISAIQQSDLVAHIYTLFFTFHYGLSLDIEYSSLCYTVGPCFFIRSIYNSLHMLIPNSKSISPSPFISLGKHKS